MNYIYDAQMSHLLSDRQMIALKGCPLGSMPAKVECPTVMSSIYQHRLHVCHDEQGGAEQW